MRTVQDHIEAADAADARAKRLRAEIARTEQALAYYARLDVNAGGQSYITGGYVLTDGDGQFIERGLNGQQMRLQPAHAGLSTASKFTTAKQADEAAARFARWFPDEPKVQWTGHRTAIEAHLRRTQAALAEQEKIVRASDPYFDASPAAQDFDANSSF